MSEAKTIHLAESNGPYDDPDTWCGVTSFDHTEDLDLVTCAECLKAAIEFGDHAEREIE